MEKEIKIINPTTLDGEPILEDVGDGIAFDIGDIYSPLYLLLLCQRLAGGFLHDVHIKACTVDDGMVDVIGISLRLPNQLFHTELLFQLFVGDSNGI